MNKLTCILLYVLSSCVSSKRKQKTAPQKSPSASDPVLLASIERTPCFGKCPTYKIRIYQNGYVAYEGKQNVKNIGKFSTQLDRAKVEEIKNYIIQNKILELNDKYVNPNIADFPTIYTEANLNGKYKHITEMEMHVPDQLKEYEKFLDSLFNDDTAWTPLDK